MPRVSVRLFWMAVASNALALGILVWGTLSLLTLREQLLTIILTSISMICWLAYFRRLHK